MGYSQLLVLVVVLLVGAGYWWHTQGRHGSRATLVHLGLREGEEVRHTFPALFKRRFGGLDIPAAARGVRESPKGLSLTLTTGDELILRIDGAEPQRYKPGEFRLTLAKEDDDKLAGTSGALEVADVYRVDPVGSEPFHIRLARTSAQVLSEWNESGAAR